MANPNPDPDRALAQFVVKQAPNNSSSMRFAHQKHIPKYQKKALTTFLSPYPHQGV